MKTTNNLILAITFLPMVLGFYFSLSDLQLSVFCFALFGFMVFFLSAMQTQYFDG